MKSNLKLALFGYGRFGKIHLKELQKNKFLKCSVIIKKNNLSKKKIKKIEIISYNEFIKKKNLFFDCAIIASDVKSHFKIGQILVKKKIPFILEKPATENLYQAIKLNKFAKKMKTSILVNYSDLFDLNLQYIKKNIRDVGKINFIEINFTKKQNIYINDKPFYDWAPHILAIINTFVEGNLNFKILKNEIYKKNNKLYQQIFLIFRNHYGQKIKVFFSNGHLLKQKRNVVIHGSNGKFNYDGKNIYQNFFEQKKRKKYINNDRKNITPLQNLYSEFYKSVKKNKNIFTLDDTISIQRKIEQLKKKGI